MNGAVAPLRTLGNVVAQLCPPVSVPLPDALVYSDIGEFDLQFALQMRRDVYPARIASLDAVELVALPPGATLLAGTLFALRIGRKLVAEQLAPHLRTPAAAAALQDAQEPAEQIAAPCLLVARFGAATWGHWLAEILPRLVLAEREFPRRFSFAVPHWTAQLRLPGQAEWGPRWDRVVRDTLAAHGIGEDRMVPIDPFRSVCFRQLFSVTPVWSDDVLHPHVAAAMRDAIPLDHAPPARRVALLRHAAAGRAILDAAAIYDHLAARGFHCVAAGGLPFLDQVALFRQAEHVFGVLGSDLAGLLYGLDGVRVISAAPAQFGDRFFYALVQLRHGRYADLRGPAQPHAAFEDHRRPFTITPEQIDAALAACDIPYP